MSPAVIGSLLSAAGSIGGGLLSRGGSRETPIQKQQRASINEILAGLKGGGPLAELFSSDESRFQRQFSDPAKQRFQTQTAPQIQQSFLAGGQQRGTGLEDTLTRAGVDMDMLLNQQFGEFQNQAENRKLQALSAILGQGAGAAPTQSFGRDLSQSFAGYLASPSFGQGLESILGSFNAPGTLSASRQSSGGLTDPFSRGSRRGFIQ